jgi:hypothetical protein
MNDIITPSNELLPASPRLFIFSGSAAQRGLCPPRSRGFVIIHNDVPQSVGLLWTSDQPVAGTSTWQHTQNNHPCPRWYFFLIVLYSFVSCTFCSIVLIVLSYCVLWIFTLWKSDGFGRERTRDLGFQRPARKHLHHRPRDFIIMP